MPHLRDDERHANRRLVAEDAVRELAVLAKPFPLMKLLELVREILERSDKARKTNGEGRRQA